MTTDELAAHTGYNRRWLMEWLRAVTSAKVLEYEKGTDTTEKFRLAPEMGVLLAEEADMTNPMFIGGFFQGGFPKELVDGTMEAFRTGIGMSYRAQGLLNGGPENVTNFVRRASGPWAKTALVPLVIPALAGGKMAEVLRRPGAKALDMGCGSGVAACAMASAFPEAVVNGVDPDVTALGNARREAAAQGLRNVEFIEAMGETLGKEDEYDFAMCLDIVHDSAFPDRILRALHKALKPGGTLLVKDIRSTGDFSRNMEELPMLPMYYGFSLAACLSCATSEPGAMGLGTVGFNPPVAERMLKEAGLSYLMVHDFNDPRNVYYECMKPGGNNPGLRPAATSAVDLSRNPAPPFCACCSLAWTGGGGDLQGRSSSL